MSKDEDVKKQSTAGLANAVDMRSKLVLDIQVEPTLLMVPSRGVYSK